MMVPSPSRQVSTCAELPPAGGFACQNASMPVAVDVDVGQVVLILVLVEAEHGPDRAREHRVEQRLIGLDDAAGVDAVDLRQRHRRQHAAEPSARFAVGAERRHAGQPARVDQIHLHARAGEIEVERDALLERHVELELVGARR